jgi:uncharacterized protein (TIGR02569 family)
MACGPAPEVVEAFGGVGTPAPIEDGRGDSWRVGDLVLKPAGPDAEGMLRWLDGVVRPLLRPTDLRIALPVQARDGSLRCGGWAATRLLAGARAVGRWRERAEIARRFAAALEDVDPASLPPRGDPWAVADRASWGEEAGPLADHPLSRALRRVHEPTRIVHGDLAGNTLVHPSLPPGVIDLSLYARPVEWSVAVLAIDVVAFEGAPAGVLRTISEDPQFPQLLTRALLFRMTTDVLLGGKPGAAYAPVERMVLAMVE